ncbi:MAG: hypothetical protein ACREA0_14135, partial [bacterium]
MDGITIGRLLPLGLGLVLIVGGLLLGLLLTAVAVLAVWRVLIVLLRVLGFLETSLRWEAMRTRVRSVIRELPVPWKSDSIH